MIIAPASREDPWAEAFLGYLRWGAQLAIAVWFPFRAEPRPKSFWVPTPSGEQVPGEVLEDGLLRQPTLQEFSVGLRSVRVFSAGRDQEESLSLSASDSRLN